MPNVPQPVTDDAIKVRQVSHYQFTWVVGQPAANGTFTTVWKLSRFTIFVAQWAGDADHQGAGSKVLQVNVK